MPIGFKERKERYKSNNKNVFRTMQKIIFLWATSVRKKIG